MTPSYSGFIHFMFGGLPDVMSKEKKVATRFGRWVIPCQTSWTLQLDPLQICSKCGIMLYGMIDLHTKNFSSISLVLLKIWRFQICYPLMMARAWSFSAIFKSAFL